MSEAPPRPPLPAAGAPAAASPAGAAGRFALLVTGASGMLLAGRTIAALATHGAVERLHLVVSRGAGLVLQHELGRDRGAPPPASAVGPGGGSGPAGPAGGAAELLRSAALPPAAAAKLVVHRDGELDAAISSGSYRLAGTAVVPCSAGTIGALATGEASTLVHRAGAVALKERWPLVLAFRETPLSVVHLENLRRLAYAGAVILPPIPAFYIGGEDLDRFLDHWLLRLLDHLGLPAAGAPGLRWG